MKKKAFTLLELLIVIVVLGILAIIAIPQYLSAVDEARIATGLSNLKEIRNISMGYYQQWGEWPDKASSDTVDLEYNILGDAASQPEGAVKFTHTGWTYVISKAAGTATAKHTDSGTTRVINLETGEITTP